MADSRRIVFEFVSDVSGLEQGLDETRGSLADTDKSLADTTGFLDKIPAAAQLAGAAAAAAAAAWAKEGVEMSTEAARIEKNFTSVFGSADALGDEVEFLAGHMGLAQYEAQGLLADVGALGQSMGMSQQESTDYAAAMFALAGDMATFNPEAGNAADAMEALTKAANGSTKGMAAWDVSLKAAEVDARALADTGKETTAELTQQDKALATLALVTEKQAAAQGGLNEAIAEGSTEYKEANADIADMQKEVGDALQPIKKLTLEGLVILSRVLVALGPIFDMVSVALDRLLRLIQPLLDLLGWLIDKIGVVIGWFTQLDSWLGRLGGSFDRLSGKIRSAFSWTPPSWMQSMGIRGFHSGGTVPGPPGSEQTVRVQAGETIQGASTSRTMAAGGDGGAAGPVINVTVNAGVGDPMAIGREIANVLGEYSRNVGGVDVQIRGGGVS